MKRLNRFGLEAKEHWREHLPKMFQKLQSEGMLEKALLFAQERTMQEMSALESLGMTPDEAWEATREKYLILREEPDLEDLPPSNPLYEALMEAESDLREFQTPA